jgi:hypothetical protein
VEKRHRRRNCDGRNVLEKARERKRLVNLETGKGKGNTKSIFIPLLCLNLKYLI